MEQIERLVACGYSDEVAAQMRAHVDTTNLREILWGCYGINLDRFKIWNAYVKDPSPRRIFFEGGGGITGYKFIFFFRSCYFFFPLRDGLKGKSEKTKKAWPKNTAPEGK